MRDTAGLLSAAVARTLGPGVGNGWSQSRPGLALDHGCPGPHPRDLAPPPPRPPSSGPEMEPRLGGAECAIFSNA